jgi:predicted ATPase/GAF domain-containing protein/HPt (histidine-containing phosphotransfer) domain-containing protein
MDDLAARYVVEAVNNDAGSRRVRRGFLREDDSRVVFKLPRTEYPSATELAQLRHEHALLERLHEAGVGGPVELVRYGHGLAIVQRDGGTTSLASLVRTGPLTLGDFLHYARLATQAVEAVHSCGVLHKDLKPEHFLLDASPGAAPRLVLIDFGIADTLGEQRSEQPIALEGTLAYISPEQTGRTNRRVDRRSDLYSLGVTLYELLTGARPFTMTDPLELVHAHIARVPRPPCELGPTPQVVSDIVLRLLEKVPERRYQSAAGLKADLERCAAELDASGQIAPFELGREDFASELSVPQKLYGRESSIRVLQSALERARRGATELILVSGAAGVGKSALVGELRGMLALAGTFVSGKFDQLQRGIPYAGMARAIAELVREELTGPAQRLEAWKAAIVEAVGQNGQLLLDLVPQLERVIGPQPKVLELGAHEAQNRFEAVFQAFLRTATSAERPLVIFLDDLQWADAASLRLLSLLMRGFEKQHLLLVVSYRDNEVNPAQGLPDFIAEARAAGAVEQRLQPLKKLDLQELLEDTLRPSAENCAALAELVMEKTEGNPFFVAQFLDALQRSGALAFDAVAKAWTWQSEAIAATEVTANVVDLVVTKLRKLEGRAQSLLQLAACLGHRFELGQLGLISNTEPAQIALSLQEAAREGFIVPLDVNHRLLAYQADSVAVASASYRFTHDRVQQAAYALMPESERGPIHLGIGRHLLAGAGPSGPSDEAIFEIVGPLNLGRAHITDADERQRVATLNVRAAQRAKEASAPAMAHELCGVALSLLGDDAWRVDPVSTRKAHVLRAECAHQVGHDAVALESIDQLKQHAQSLLQRVEAENLHALMLLHQGRLAESTQASLAALGYLGVSLPEPTDKAAVGAAIGAAFGAYQQALAGRSVASLESLELMTDPEALALVATYCAAIPAAFQWNPELMFVLVLQAVAVPLTRGTAPQSAFLYQQYALVHSAMTGDYETAHQFAQLGLRLNERPESHKYSPAVYFIYAGFNSHWKQPFSDSLQAFKKGARVAVELGDQIHAAYCMSLGAVYRFGAGEPLDGLLTDARAYSAALAASKDVINLGFLSIVEGTIVALQGMPAAARAFVEDRRYLAAPPPVTLLFGTHAALVAYLMRDTRGALEATDRFPPLPGLLYGVDHWFYRALASLELARGAGDEREALLERARTGLALFEKWAASCPENYAHRKRLLEAEWAAFEGKREAASELYERAIPEAAAQGQSLQIALANELCARFYVRCGQRKAALGYLLEARYHYERWGAPAKARLLESEFTELGSSRGDVMRTITVSSATSTGADLDLMSAMRATQAIASELVLDSLVERLLRILVENAGAQRGCLLLSQGQGQDPTVMADFRIDPEQIELGLSEPAGRSGRVAASVVHYVARSHESVVLDDVRSTSRFARDDYFKTASAVSLLCLPLLHQSELVAVLYLEHASASGVFSASRLERLGFLGAHAAVAIQNAKLYGQVQAATRRLQEANAQLDQKVRERTLQLELRNADMQRVLDNIGQALITIDLQGRIAAERSAVAERWFGELVPGRFLHQELARVDSRFGAWLGTGLAWVESTVLSLEMVAEQLPTRLVCGERSYTVGYSPIRDGEIATGFLVIIDDVTEAVRAAATEAEQRQQLVFCQKLAQDRFGLLGFLDDGDQRLEEMARPGCDPVVFKRHLHTLKGNAAIFGFSLIAECAHAAEDRLAQGEEPIEQLETLRKHWRSLGATRDLLLGVASDDRFEVRREALEGLLADIRAGMSAEAIAEELARWPLEPLSHPFRRLAEYGLALAQRLDKAPARIGLADRGVAADPRKGRVLWSVLVHLVRNAVDHGFHAREGAENSNQLEFCADVHGADLVVQVRDTGRGVDWERVRSLAAQRGLPHATREQLAQALLAPGFSTCSEISTSSGRGVGLGAVKQVIEALGGSLSVESERGAGCLWTVRVPTRAVGARGAQSKSEPRLRHSNRPLSA